MNSIIRCYIIYEWKATLVHATIRIGDDAFGLEERSATCLDHQLRDFISVRNISATPQMHVPLK